MKLDATRRLHIVNPGVTVRQRLPVGAAFDPEQGLALTATLAPSSSLDWGEDRSANVVFACDVKFPSSPSDGVLFENGAAGLGSWVGLRDGGTVFRARTGAGDVLPQSQTASVDTVDFPSDGQVHTVVFEFDVSNSRCRLWIDGDLKGEDTSAPFSGWTGVNAGSYILEPETDVCAGEPATAWPAGTDGASDLRYYEGQLVNQ